MCVLFGRLAASYWLPRRGFCSATGATSERLSPLTAAAASACIGSARTSFAWTKPAGRPADRQAAAAHTGSAEQREERGTPRVRPFAGRPTVRAKAATATAAAKMAAVPGLQPATPACVRLCVASVGRVSAQRTNCRPHHFWSASEPADKERTNRTANDAARSLCPKTCSSDTSTRIYRQPSNLQRSHVFTLLETASLRPVCKHLYRETLEFCVIARRYFNLI